MFARIEPEPSPDEREAILAALELEDAGRPAWAGAALAEGVEQDEPPP